MKEYGEKSSMLNIQRNMKTKSDRMQCSNQTHERNQPGQSKNKTELIKIIFDMVHFISKRTEIIM